MKAYQGVDIWIHSAVSIVTDYRLDDRGVGVWVLVKVKNFLLSTSSTTALGPTQPPIQWVPAGLSPGVKRHGREADHPSPATDKVKKCGSRIRGSTIINDSSQRMVSSSDQFVHYEIWNCRIHVSKILSRFRGVTIDGVWIGVLDLLTTCIHHLKLQFTFHWYTQTLVSSVY
jgi:hypothetical protein